jgi:hypothetical protein
MQMQRDEQPNQPPHRRWRRGQVLLVAASLAIFAAVIAVSLLTREGDNVTSPGTTGSAGSVTNTVPSKTIENRAEIVARLHEIFGVRDRAIETRNESLLESIYTVDCPCLEGDRNLIRRLKQENILWRGIKVSLRIDNVERVNDRLWTASALVTTAAFEIKRESGEVVRRISRGQELSRFALAKPIGQEDWLLGQASLVEERG